MNFPSKRKIFATPSGVARQRLDKAGLPDTDMKKVEVAGVEPASEIRNQ